MQRSRVAIETAYYKMHQEQMDLKFKFYAQPLNQLLAQQSTTDVWCLFWTVAETATAEFLNLDATEATKLRGRGNYHVKEWVAHPLHNRLQDNQLSPNNMPPPPSA